MKKEEGYFRVNRTSLNLTRYFFGGKEKIIVGGEKRGGESKDSTCRESDEARSFSSEFNFFSSHNPMDISGILCDKSKRSNA